MAPEKKSVLITGCSPGGIGHALALEFHSRGLRVFATARDKGVLKDLEEAGLETLSLDVNNLGHIAEVKDEVTRRTGGTLDLLVNNAGRSYTMPVIDMDFDQIHATFNVNLFAVMRMCQTFIPLLIQAKGTILNVGSIAGMTPFVFGGAYNASKAALHSYSNTLRVELAPLGVKVVLCISGGVKSRIARDDYKLPDGSHYLPIVEEYRKKLEETQKSAIPADLYARKVVAQVLRSSPPKWIWEGSSSWIAWFLDVFAPRSIWDLLYSRLFCMKKLAGIRAATAASSKSSA